MDQALERQIKITTNELDVPFAVEASAKHVAELRAKLKQAKDADAVYEESIIALNIALDKPGSLDGEERREIALFGTILQKPSETGKTLETIRASEETIENLGIQMEAAVRKEINAQRVADESPQKKAAYELAKKEVAALDERLTRAMEKDSNLRKPKEVETAPPKEEIVVHNHAEKPEKLLSFSEYGHLISKLEKRIKESEKEFEKMTAKIVAARAKMQDERFATTDLGLQDKLEADFAKYEKVAKEKRAKVFAQAEKDRVKLAELNSKKEQLAEVAKLHVKLGEAKIMLGEVKNLNSWDEKHKALVRIVVKANTVLGDKRSTEKMRQDANNILASVEQAEAEHNLAAAREGEIQRQSVFQEAQRKIDEMPRIEPIKLQTLGEVSPSDDSLKPRKFGEPVPKPIVDDNLPDGPIVKN